MSHLFLVRHGQATFPYQDQDHLTGIGQAQAQLLGCFWAAEKIERYFDREGDGVALDALGAATRFLEGEEVDSGIVLAREGSSASGTGPSRSTLSPGSFNPVHQI